ncbi:MAG: metallophosphatase, partial [Alphaproteobacteria bacterium]
MPNSTDLDIIGDIHGHADRLEGLLLKLGYRQSGGAWRHPQRTAVFVGDLVDRGSQQRRTLETVRAMVE